MVLFCLFLSFCYLWPKKLAGIFGRVKKLLKLMTQLNFIFDFVKVCNLK
jgi:hypothetical protein